MNGIALLVMMMWAQHHQAQDSYRANGIVWSKPEHLCAITITVHDARRGATGREFHYCLNPVDEKTGKEIPPTALDIKRIQCALGRALCDDDLIWEGQ